MVSSRLVARHDSECPEIGPVCAMRHEPPQRHHTTLWLTDVRLLAEYGLTRHLALQAMVPFRIVGQSTRYTDLAGTPVELDYENIHHRNQTLAGLGDAQLLVHTATTLGGFRLGGRAGFSIPTGKVHEDPFRLGEEGLPHQHIQLGTGTFDPIVAVDVARDLGPLTLALFGYSQVPFYEGDKGYQAGTRIAAGLVASSSFGLERPIFRLSVTALQELAERWRGAVRDDDGNRGRTDLFVGLGLTMPFAGDWSASLDFRARVWGQMIGAQLDMPVIVQLSIGRLFHLESGRHEDTSTAPAGDVAELVVAGELAPIEGVPGKWTIIDFWAPWCEACVALDTELRAWVRADSRLALRRVNIVDFDSLIATRELSGVALLPHLRLVAPDGSVAFEGSGPSDELLAKVKAVVSTRFTCPMHPDVVRDAPGTCPHCAMPLEPVKQ